MLALQALYGLEMNSDAVAAEAVESAWEESEGAGADRDFLDRLVAGAWRVRKELDRLLEKSSKNWKLSRMDRVDKCILRLAAYELLHEPDTPAPVILDEGVELAKEFGTPESASFINGILDRIAREVRPTEVAARGS